MIPAVAAVVEEAEASQAVAETTAPLLAEALVVLPLVASAVRAVRNAIRRTSPTSSARRACAFLPSRGHRVISCKKHRNVSRLVAEKNLLITPVDARMTPSASRGSIAARAMAFFVIPAVLQRVSLFRRAKFPVISTLSPSGRAAEPVMTISVAKPRPV